MILSADNISSMRTAGKVAAKILYELKGFVVAGVSTKDIELFFDNILAQHKGMKPSFKGYNGYPSSVCVSVNEEVIHGIPSPKRIISDGDLVSVDLGIAHEGIHVDCAYTYMVGNVSDVAHKLCSVTQEALKEGIKMAYPGRNIGDIGAAIEEYVESHGFSVVRQFVGHGIGRELHLPPEVPNFGVSGEGAKIYPNMALAIEPMVNIGGYEVDILRDGWTVRTRDKELSAHYEHTVLITDSEPVIITG